jgi:hypothetical protein
MTSPILAQLSRKSVASQKGPSYLGAPAARFVSVAAIAMDPTRARWPTRIA